METATTDSSTFPTRRSSDLSRERPQANGTRAQKRAESGRLVPSQARVTKPSQHLSRSHGLTMAKQDSRHIGWQAGAEIGRHTSELQSRLHLVCRLLLEKKKP